MNIFSNIQRGEAFLCNGMLYVRAKNETAFDMQLLVLRIFDRDDIVEPVSSEIRWHRTKERHDRVKFESISAGETFVWRKQLYVRAASPRTAFATAEALIEIFDPGELVEPTNAVLSWSITS
jgi:hypothetical protein